jgi:uncharacterized protein (TIGR02001 family)
MKKSLLSLFALFSVITPAKAEEISQFTGGLTFTTDYVFRGISQSNEEPTVQGNIDWADPALGLYLGVWGSGVDLAESSSEFDFYAGIAKEYAGIDWKFGGIYYLYPGADSNDDYDYWEAMISATYDFEVLAATAGLNYSPDFFAGSGDAVYASIGATIPLNDSFSLDTGYAYQWIDDNTAFGSPDYGTWSLGLTYAVKGFNLNLRYHDTDLDEPSECSDGCGERVVFSISRPF